MMTIANDRSLVPTRQSESYPKAKLLFDPLDQVRIVGCHLFTSCRSSLCKKKNRPRHQVDAAGARGESAAWRNPAQSWEFQKKIKHDALSWAGILPPSASRRQLWAIITKVAPLCPQRPQLLWPGQALPSTEVRRGNRIKCDRLARRPKGIIGEGAPWVVQTGKHPSLGWSTEGVT